MHILYAHQNYPAQFGHIADYLIANHGFQCSFVTTRPPRRRGAIDVIPYQPRGRRAHQTHYLTRKQEDYAWMCESVYDAMAKRPDVRPDIVVGHSGLGGATLLADLYDVPLVTYFEYYYGSNLYRKGFRPECPAGVPSQIRARMRNSVLLLDLATSTRGYSPTDWQRSHFPEEFQSKIESIYDGTDTEFWYPASEEVSRDFGNFRLPADKKIITYVSRGFEPIRGFDRFIKFAKRLCDLRDDVLFVCVGSDRVCYGDTSGHFGHASHRHYVCENEGCDLDRFLFTGRVSREDLRRIYHLSDLHVYFTEPFVLSWSFVQAMACGCKLLATDTEPVREFVEHGKNGLLGDFFDTDAMVEHATAVLDSPGDYDSLAQAGIDLIRTKYSLPVVVPQMIELYEDAINKHARTSDDHDPLVSIARQKPTQSRNSFGELMACHPWPQDAPTLPTGSEVTSDSTGKYDAIRDLLASERGKRELTILHAYPADLAFPLYCLTQFDRCRVIVAHPAFIPAPNGRRSRGGVDRLGYREVLARLWPYRQRVIIAPSDVPGLLHEMVLASVSADVTFIGQCNNRAMHETLNHALHTFPQGKIIGGGWNDSRRRRSVFQFVSRREVDVDTRDDIWCISRNEPNRISLHQLMGHTP